MASHEAITYRTHRHSLIRGTPDNLFIDQPSNTRMQIGV
ncbi:hypothetical protein E2C01_096395 [Portunus trituberculatus]|uniref:Uncharacterized protein n=1 Tax=Portunus trituberculatus TaxID=210409 RepID=A0A5B7K1M2_PORTR|nr:hypothetical protein [Portunus trituberculatus]